MARRQEKLKLGKGSAFVKRRLLWLPQEEFIWEAGFSPLPEMPDSGNTLWLGMVVNRQDGSILSEDILEYVPTINDFAELLANAMQRPLTDENRCRPRVICIRENPDWQELFPHLKQLGIEIVIAEDLRVYDETVAGLISYLMGNTWKETGGDTFGEFEDEGKSRDQLLNLRLLAILYPPKRQVKR